MTPTTTGWFIFIVALGSMAGLTAADVAQLKDWHDAVKPAFVGLQMMHFSVTVASFVAGKLIPTEILPRDPQMRTRDADRNPTAPVVVVTTQQPPTDGGR